MKHTPDTGSLDLFPEEEKIPKKLPPQELPKGPEAGMSLTEFAKYMEKLKGKGKTKGPSEARLEETGNL